MQFVDFNLMTAATTPGATDPAATADGLAQIIPDDIGNGPAPVVSDWSELGRFVRTAAMAAVTEHFAASANDDDLPLKDEQRDDGEVAS